MNALHYVIIGNGAAGISAAQEIRRLDKKGRITMISYEANFYYRASLSEWISGKVTSEMLQGRTDAFFEQLRIECLQGRVTQVDAELQRVYLEEVFIPYDRLLLATGALPNRLQIEGLEDSLVFRTFKDAQEIKSRADSCRRVMILGGGILGLELAGALHNLEINEIAVAQVMDYVGAPLLDLPSAEWVQAQMQADGLTIFLSDTIEKIEDQAAVFRSGRHWNFDLFIQTVGITPQIPCISGLKRGLGIQIDEHSRTNLPQVYAAGDCTETYHPVSDKWFTTRIWLDGIRQGRAAAHSMTGIPFLNQNFPFFNASYIYKVPYSYIGTPHGLDGEELVWKSQTAYRKLRIVDGCLAGALLMGDRRGNMAIFRAIGKPVSKLMGNLAEPGFSWNDLSPNDWNYYFF